MSLISRLARPLALLSLLVPTLPATAADPSELLPVDQAFVLGAQGKPDGIALHWKIADGYYLYRQRISVEAQGGGFTAGALQLPDGDKHVDEFFGPVETYRKQLDALLPGKATAAGQVTLKVRYQGCADAGLCYPPQTRTLQVAVPAAAASGAGTGLGLPLGGAAAGGSTLLGTQAAVPGATDTAPLPEAQAFAFEASADGGNQLLLRFTPAKGYYLYRDRTQLALHGAEGLSLGAPRWPPGKAHRDEHFGEVTVYFDQVEVPVPVIRDRADAAKATLEVTFQGCQTDGICYPPMTRQVALALPAGTVTPPEARAVALAAPVALEAGTAAPAATPPAPAEVPRSTPPPEALARADQGAGGASGWALALVAALLGGLILNVMPCVLPVLSLKALSLAESGRGRARAGALAYTAGVLLSFLLVGGVALALRATGQALGWGFQLQQPLVTGALAYLMFAVGLSLSGVFAVGYGLAGVGRGLTERGGLSGDFFTGVLAVVVASPCTAPFMGSALTFAFAAPVPVALAVFALLGLGLALPFLLIGLVPALAARLPRPGAWMDTLKQVLAFPMYLTAVWMLWVLGKQRGIDAVGLALVGLVVLALGLWAFQRVRFQTAPLRRGLAVVVLIASLVPLVLLHRLPAASTPAATAAADGIEPYSPQRLDALRKQGQVVFVDMTADWCVTCKANEKAVLSGDDFKQAMQSAGAVLMRGDWTNVDPQITAFLQAHKAVGVPLYVVFPKSGGEGEVLPTVLTTPMVRDALQRASAR
ncbi:protein-disulfide reductase DsbD family protein [Pseudoxanthomonas winnipegensis]|uniref:protein-disulfide reductase DsbD family protein n=1 Tax=Pseudoxanthomonas winnipegensis TaxID=2480810 RepID=UPI00103AAC4C|nr:protein-disulfide reductase DsbD [Pseudoxanthomonas winnipegensis]TBV77652.1 cytochrome C biogenesis protein [Pseudoxanthomonas winnipegensis]